MVMNKLQSSFRNYLDKFDPSQIEALSRLIIALTDGMAFQLVIRPEKLLRDDTIWKIFRRMLLALLDTSIVERERYGMGKSV
jgi:hypothetical protein